MALDTSAPGYLRHPPSDAPRLVLSQICDSPPKTCLIEECSPCLLRRGDRLTRSSPPTTL